MDLSLDDIIKKKKTGKPNNKKKMPTKKPMNAVKRPIKPSFKVKARVVDARNRIIQKNREKIRDARDKLGEITRANGDARQRLQQRQSIKEKFGLTSASKLATRVFRSDQANLPNRRAINGGKPNKQQIYRPALKVAHPSMRIANTRFNAPRGYVDYDNMNEMEKDDYSTVRVSRTVNNDLDRFNSYQPKPRIPNTMPSSSNVIRRADTWGSSNDNSYDPFDVYDATARSERTMQADMLPPASLQGIRRPNTRQRSPSEMFERHYAPEPSPYLSYEMRSRLERAPDPHASMGIFSNSSKKVVSQSPGYRIVVSNLHTSVNQSDVKELFEDIGELFDSRIVRPGVAEVIYKSLSDAEAAVDTYHNRQLDGQPMKCLLVNPRASNKPTAPALKPSSSVMRTTSGKTPLEIDIDALHKVLFRRQ